MGKPAASAASPADRLGLDEIRKRQQQQRETERDAASAAAAPKPAESTAESKGGFTPEAKPEPVKGAVGLQRIGTISINPDQIRKRENRMRKRRTKLTKTTELRKQEFVKPQKKRSLVVDIPEEIQVKQLSYQMAVKSSEVLEKLAALIDFDPEEPPELISQDEAAIIVEEFGHEPNKLDPLSATFVTAAREGRGGEFVTRPPVVTVMGHVDHGKTSLLDHIRSTKVVNTESGGITQHIGAYQVNTATGSITFIDTPGHEVFTEMRARGASVTDIVILVVAADDGVKPQTSEAISHARSADVPIVVAINKIDLPDAKPDEARQQLASQGLQPEEWGGDVIMVPVSAHTGEGIDKLLESVQVTAEVLELQAPIDVDAHGSIIEARIEKGLGVVVSVIVRSGVLRKGDFILCGTEYGRVRAMRDENGNQLKEAGPSVPVQLQGISELPEVGAEFYVTKDEQSARSYAEEQRHRNRQSELLRNHEIIEANDLDELFALTEAKEGRKVLNLIVKTDVAGTAEAMVSALDNIGNDEAGVKIIHNGVGAISESDVSLAQASDAILVGFRVTANPKARAMIRDRDLQAFYSDVFYEVTDHLKDRLVGMLEPVQEEMIRGQARVKEVFHINKVGKVAGCAVEDGMISSELPVRVVRDGVVINRTEIGELRHYKEKAKQVSAGSDCGINLSRFSDFKPGDIIESYEVKVTTRSL